MWIIPRNHSLSSRFARDMVALSEDLKLPGLNIEQSLLWRSKPSRLPTWLQRWKKTNWFRLLSLRILKPSRQSAFETELMSSLPVIHANRLAKPGVGKEQMTPGTSGLTSDSTLNQLDLFESSLKTSQDISLWDSEKSSKIWKASVIEQRGEFSQRLSVSRLMRDNASSYLHTPTATMNQMAPSMNSGWWPTPTASQSGEGEFTETLINKEGNPVRPNERAYSAKSGKHTSISLNRAVKLWPTPVARDSGSHTLSKNHTDGFNSNLVTEIAKEQMKERFEAAQYNLFPTPTTRDWKGGYNTKSLTRKDGKSRRFDLLPNAAIGGKGVETVKGHLSADWVEALMGVKAGWTDLGNWEYQE